MSSDLAPTQLLAARRELPGDWWSIETSPDGAVAIAMRTPNSVTWLTVLHDGGPAPRADVEFLAASRADVDTVLRCLQNGVPINEDRLRKIRKRLEAATTGEWVYYLESDGGLGGSNVITMEGSEADLYLLINGRLAPDAIWVFAALAHREISAMLAAVVVSDEGE
jgi:hypothetical protein